MWTRRSPNGKLLLTLVSLTTAATLYVTTRLSTQRMETLDGQRIRERELHGRLRRQRELSAQITECVAAHMSKARTISTAADVSKMTTCLQHVVQPSRLVPELVASFLAEPVTYPFNYDFTLNQEQACTDKSDLEVIVVIPSAPHFSKRRRDVRNSERGRWTKDPSNNAVLLFFLGLPSSNDTGSKLRLQKEIEAEAKMYGDIIQADFLDNYKNILLKALSMLKWTSTYCQNAKYVIRTDDDVNVTMSDIIHVMRTKTKQYQNFVIGHRKIGDIPARGKNKWHLSKKEYPHKTFPPYVRGGLIGYPVSTVRLLYEASVRLPPIWLDDVFVTGLCTLKLGIPVLADKKFTFSHKLKLGDFGPGVVVPGM